MQQTQKSFELEELVGTLRTTFGSKETEHNWSACDEILIQISRLKPKNLKIDTYHDLFWKIQNVLGQCVLFHRLIFSCRFYLIDPNCQHLR
jgi:hypothetical protein